MVERNQLKVANPVDVADEDPFAELTRIMGFDPRQPAPSRPEAPLPRQEVKDSPVEESSMDESFHIDLEKELMGEFGDEEDSLQAEPAVSWAAPEPAPHPVVDDADFSAFDLAFEDALADPEPEAEIQAEPEVVLEDFWTSEPEAEELEPEAPAAYAFAPAEYAPAVEPVATAPVFEDYAASAEVDSAVLEEEDYAFAPADYAPAVEPAATVFEDYAAPAEADSGVLEEEDYALADDDYVPPAADYFVPVEPVAAAPVRSFADDDFATSFDAALADVDMDFESHNAPAEADAEDDLVAMELDLLEDEEADSVGAYESFEAQPAAYEAAPVAYEDEPVAYEAESEAYEPAAYAAEPTAYEAEPAAYEAEPAAYEAEPAVYEADPAVYETEDFDPENDELATEIAFDLSEAAHEADAARYVEPEPVESPAPVESIEFDLEQELNALLGNRPAHVAETVASPAYAEPEADVLGPAELVDDLGWDLADDDLLATDEQPVAAEMSPAPDYAWSAQADEQSEDEVLGDIDLEFDHEAFDAAIAKGFDGDELAGEFSLEDEAAPESEDPLDAIDALKAQYASPAAVSYSRANNVAASPAVYAPQPVAQEDVPEIDLDLSAFDEVPDIETVDVSDGAVALADDLDLPEFTFEEEVTPVSAYDDLDTEFASLISQMNTSEPAQPAAYEGDRTFGAAAPAYAAATAAGYAGARATHAAYDDDADQNRYEVDRYDLAEGQPGGQGAYAADPFDYDPQLDEEISLADGTAVRERAPRQGRGMMLAAIVGGVALLGGVGAFALSWGNGGSSDAPVIVKADNGPIKVKPASPGGTTVPNQESKVYDTVAGAGATKEPQQKTLVTTAEEPVDVSPPVPEARSVDLAPAEDQMPAEDQAEAAVTPKGEDRIEQMIEENAATPDAEVAAVAPRKVRTMVVKPDGTLVPREDPAPVEAAAPPAPTPETVASVEREPAADLATGSTAPIDAPVTGSVPAANETTAAVPPAVEAPAAVKPSSKAQSSTTPDTVPIAPTRPAEQPIDVVGEVKPDQVAAISAPAATAAASGTWSMQIASQPSEAAAQASYQDLARRYGSVLNGRQANIVKAEIAGKGTFWRVRVPAQSRNDAVSLCESYKAAGGNCFVSR